MEAALLWSREELTALAWSVLQIRIAAAKHTKHKCRLGLAWEGFPFLPLLFGWLGWVGASSKNKLSWEHDGSQRGQRKGTSQHQWMGCCKEQVRMEPEQEEVCVHLSIIPVHHLGSNLSPGSGEHCFGS